MGETLPITYIFKEVGGSHVYKNHVSIYTHITFVKPNPM